LRRAVKRYQIEKENIELQIQQLQRNIKLEVRRAYQDLIKAERRLELAKKQLEIAKKNLSAAEGRYKAGVGTIVELMDAEASLSSASVGKLEALYTYILANYTLKKVIGEQF
jgi:outer membrane protein TolC